MSPCKPCTGARDLALPAAAGGHVNWARTLRSRCWTSRCWMSCCQSWSRCRCRCRCQTRRRWWFSPPSPPPHRCSPPPRTWKPAHNARKQATAIVTQGPCQLVVSLLQGLGTQRTMLLDCAPAQTELQLRCSKAALSARLRCTGNDAEVEEVRNRPRAELRSSYLSTFFLGRTVLLRARQGIAYRLTALYAMHSDLSEYETYRVFGLRTLQCHKP